MCVCELSVDVDISVCIVLAWCIQSFLPVCQSFTCCMVLTVHWEHTEWSTVCCIWAFLISGCVLMEWNEKQSSYSVIFMSKVVSMVMEGIFFLSFWIVVNTVSGWVLSGVVHAVCPSLNAILVYGVSQRPSISVNDIKLCVKPAHVTVCKCFSCQSF